MPVGLPDWCKIHEPLTLLALSYLPPPLSLFSINHHFCCWYYWIYYHYCLFHLLPTFTFLSLTLYFMNSTHHNSPLSRPFYSSVPSTSTHNNGGPSISQQYTFSRPAHTRSNEPAAAGMYQSYQAPQHQARGTRCTGCHEKSESIESLMQQIKLQTSNELQWQAELDSMKQQLKSTVEDLNQARLDSSEWKIRLEQAELKYIELNQMAVAHFKSTSPHLLLGRSNTGNSQSMSATEPTISMYVSSTPTAASSRPLLPQVSVPRSTTDPHGFITMGTAPANTTHVNSARNNNNAPHSHAVNPPLTASADARLTHPQPANALGIAAAARDNAASNQLTRDNGHDLFDWDNYESDGSVRVPHSLFDAFHDDATPYGGVGGGLMPLTHPPVSPPLGSFGHSRSDNMQLTCKDEFQLPD